VLVSDGVSERVLESDCAMSDSVSGWLLVRVQ
jgi:hypothetical protein